MYNKKGRINRKLSVIDGSVTEKSKGRITMRAIVIPSFVELVSNHFFSSERDRELTEHDCEWP